MQVPTFGSIEALTQEIAPSGAGFGICDCPGDLSALFPTERQLVVGASARRIGEFCAGRGAAHIALERLGVEAQAVSRDSRGSPIWPSGVVGSISHTRHIAVAAVAPGALIASIGIDIDEWAPIEPELWESLMTGAEMARFLSDRSEDRGLECRIIFSVKEAAYKSQYPLTRTLLEFTDAEVIFDIIEGSFSVEFVSETVRRSLSNYKFAGRFGIASSTIETCCAAYLLGINNDLTRQA